MKEKNLGAFTPSGVPASVADMLLKSLHKN